MVQRTAQLPPSVIAGLVLAVGLDTVAQIAWKLAVAGIPAEAPPLVAARAVLAAPLFYVAMAAFGAQLWNWLRVLARADLSFAQPFTALSYVTVLAVSRALLHEPLGPARLLGVALILVGVACIARTPAQTTATP
jgi:drug/metabolite transporter (DMT)-like permease